MTCTVTGVAGLPTGQTFPNGVFLFTRVPSRVIGYSGRVVPPVPFTVTSDGGGNVEFTAVPGAYQVLEQTYNQKFTINVPEATTADFVDCVESATVAPTPNAMQEVFDARDAAQTAATDAETYAAAAAGAARLGFLTRAELVAWAATETEPDGIVASAEGLTYYKSTGATSLSDIPNWLPFGEVYVGHFGAEGVQTAAANLLNFSTITVTVDEASLLQAAMDYCLSRGYDLYGNVNRVYGIQSTLVWGARAASGTGSSVIGQPTLFDLNLKVIGGTWTAGSRPDADDITTWSWGNPALIVGKNSAADSLGKFRVSTNNVFVDGNQLATGGIWYRAASQREHIGNRAVQCKDYQIRIGGTSSGHDCTDSVFIACAGSEWTYVASGTGYNDISLRTAVGLLTQGSDVECVGCTFSSSLYSLAYDGGYNTRFTACKFWNGTVRTDAASRTVWISTRVGVWNFDGCRFDDGAVLLEAFEGRIVNTRFMQSGVPGNLQLRATSAGETAGGLVIVGNTFDDEAQATLLTKGSGTWGSITAVISANVGSSSQVEYSLDGTQGPVITQYSDAGASIRTTASLTLDANWQGGGGNVRREVRIANQGVVHHVFNYNGYRKFGYQSGTGGGDIMLEAFGVANQYYLEPLQSDGATLDFTHRLEYDPAKTAWGVYGNLVAAADFVQRMTAPATYAAGATMAAADFQKAAVTYTGAGANNLQMPLGSDLDTQFPGVATNQGLEFTVIATSTGAATLTVNTGVTIVGSATVTGNTSGTFKLRKTGTATWVVYRK